MSRNHAAHFVLSFALTSSLRQQNGAQGKKGKGHGGGKAREREDCCRRCSCYAATASLTLLTLLLWRRLLSPYLSRSVKRVNFHRTPKTKKVVLAVAFEVKNMLLEIRETGAIW